MKKRVLAIMMASAMMAASLAGCGSSDTTGSSDSSSDSADSSEVTDVTLTVWGPSEDQSEDNGNWLQTQCDAFAEEHPEWNITFEYGTCSESEAKDKLATDAEAGADVYMYANDQIPDLLNAGAIAQFGGDYLAAIEDANPDTMVASVTYEDAVYGVPFTANTWFMYYDTRVFSEEDITNLDTMLEKGTVSFPLTNSWYIASFYAGNGCTLFGEDGTDAEAGIDFSGDKAVAVTNYLVDLAANANFSNDADGSGLAGLADGSVNAIFSGTWDYDAVVAALGEENVGIAQLPTYTLDGEAVQMKSFAGSKAIGYNPNTEYPEAAAALAVYLGSESAQQAHYDTRSIIPTISSIDVEGNALAQAQMDTVDNASIMQPLASGMSNYWTPAQSMGEEIVNGTVTHDNAAEKTEDMNTTMNTDAVE